MVEYISKKSITTPLENVIKFGIADEEGDHVITAETMLTVINATPSANVPEIVRCKDCVHYGGIYGDNECSLITSLAQPRVWLKTKPDDFCSSGKRKGDEELD